MSNPPGDTTNAQETTSAPFDEHVLENELAQQCMSTIEEYQKTCLDKGSAMVEVAKIIRESRTCTGAAKADSICGYFKIINSEETEHNSTLRSDMTWGNGPFEMTRLPGETGQGDEHGQSSSRQNPAEFGERQNGNFGVDEHEWSKRKRKVWEPGDGVSDEEEPSKFDTSKLPWEIKEVLSPAKLHPELWQTHELLRLFMEDYKAIKASLAVSPKRPEFPDSEWDNIIRGRAVDLNKVLSAMFIVGTESKCTKFLGSLKLLFGQPVPIKRVTSLGEWSLAWGRTSQAICFIFPHRKEELAVYGEHIMSLFKAISIQFHGRIILYDQSVRARTACRNDILLSDFSRFEDLRTMHISSLGTALPTNKVGGQLVSQERKVDVKSDQPCRRYNLEQCPQMSQTCRYLHICSYCRQTGHVNNRCLKKAWTEWIQTHIQTSKMGKRVSLGRTWTQWMSLCSSYWDNGSHSISLLHLHSYPWF
jgi:hypothetical protein